MTPSQGLCEPAVCPRPGPSILVNRVRTFQGLGIATAVATYVTMVLGGYVAATGAGLACPDWPTCRGSLVPDFARPGVLIEYVHRLCALMTAVLIGATAVCAFAWFRRERRILLLASGSAGLLTVQILVGMLAITSRLDPLVVTAHLALATATFAATTAHAVVSRTLSAPRSMAPAGPA